MTDLQEAAKTILMAGCSGVSQLTWDIDNALNGPPRYPAGDAFFESKEIHEAVEAALTAMAGGNT